ncbi:MAG: ATP-binding protein, partial [Chloroflexota bacterium]
ANPAVALFLRSLAAANPARPAAPLSPADLSHAVAIVRLLDGLPLAIELAAAQGLTLPLPSIVRLLETLGLDALARGRRDAPARFHTMQAAIAWSADLLPEPAPALLRLLGVFRGGWTVELLLAVASRLGRPTLPTALPPLAETQLVQPDSAHPGRLRMLEPIRMYAAERLRAAGEEPAARAAHAAAYLAWARDQARLVAGPEPLDALDALDADLPNLLAALDHAASPGGDPSDALQTAAELGQYWEVRGRVSEGRAALAAAIAAAGLDAAPTVPLMEAMFYAGYLAYLQTDLPAVEEARARLRPLAAAASLPEYAGRVAILDVLVGDLDGVDPGRLLGPIQAAHDALEGTDYGLSWQQSLVLAANLLLERGDAESALPLHYAYAARTKRRGAAIHGCAAEVWLGFTLLELGRPAEARGHFVAALAGSRGSRAITPIAWGILGIAIAITGAGPAGETGDLAARAALLHGAFDAEADRHRLGLSAMQGRLRDGSRALLAETLGADRFAALLAEGRELSPDEALDLSRA